MNPSLFDNNEEPKQIMRIGLYSLVKYKPSVKKRGITNERQAILETIRTTINEERANSKEKKKYPPLTGRALAIKLSHIKKLSDLYFMDSEAKDYKNRGKGTYGQYIFGSIKPKK